MLKRSGIFEEVLFYKKVAIHLKLLTKRILKYSEEMVTRFARGQHCPNIQAMHLHCLNLSRQVFYSAFKNLKV